MAFFQNAKPTLGVHILLVPASKRYSYFLRNRGFKRLGNILTESLSLGGVE